MLRSPHNIQTSRTMTSLGGTFPQRETGPVISPPDPRHPVQDDQRSNVEDATGQVRTPALNGNEYLVRFSSDGLTERLIDLLLREGAAAVKPRPGSVLVDGQAVLRRYRRQPQRRTSAVVPVRCRCVVLLVARVMAWVRGREVPDGSVVQNWVRLRGTGGRVQGNRLVRGVVARAVTEELLGRQRRRGNPVEGFDVGGELIYAATAGRPARAHLHQAALEVLADADVEGCSWQAWREAVYLLNQAPLTKKGSDATYLTHGSRTISPTPTTTT